MVLALRDRVSSQEKWPRDLDGMLGLLGVKPLPLGIGKQSQELIDLLLIRTHQERPGLDANQRHADRIATFSVRQGRWGLGFGRSGRGLAGPILGRGRGRHPPQVKLDSSYESVDVDVEVSPLVHLGCVAKGKWGERRREVGLGWHPDTIDPDRDHWDATLERGFNLDPDEIPRVIKPAPSAGLTQPLCPDHREKDVTPGHLGVDVFPKIHAERYGIDVHHNRIAAEVVPKPVVDPTGHTGRILPPIGEEYLRHHGLATSVLPSCLRPDTE